MRRYTVDDWEKCSDEIRALCDEGSVGVTETLEIWADESVLVFRLIDQPKRLDDKSGDIAQIIKVVNR